MSDIPLGSLHSADELSTLRDAVLKLAEANSLASPINGNFNISFVHSFVPSFVLLSFFPRPFVKATSFPESLFPWSKRKKERERG